jgi:hypothetical protein
LNPQSAIGNPPLTLRVRGIAAAFARANIGAFGWTLGLTSPRAESRIYSTNTDEEPLGPRTELRTKDKWCRICGDVRSAFSREHFARCRRNSERMNSARLLRAAVFAVIAAGRSRPARLSGSSEVADGFGVFRHGDPGTRPCRLCTATQMDGAWTARTWHTGGVDRRRTVGGRALLARLPDPHTQARHQAGRIPPRVPLP